MTRCMARNGVYTSTPPFKLIVTPSKRITSRLPCRFTAVSVWFRPRHHTQHLGGGEGHEADTAARVQQYATEVPSSSPRKFHVAPYPRLGQGVHKVTTLVGTPLPLRVCIVASHSVSLAMVRAIIFPSGREDPANSVHAKIPPEPGNSNI
ncbi:hypothetical protein E2C01_089413 [Portunus trituberculatus]|uniref:Uncharacterized protein n=1 Tax=Portunus trituberculatus TaxID=210409 RepID=A0A5B7J8Q5_PORTR|nr:hypothetical protein [Portunus trituberculatus]